MGKPFPALCLCLAFAPAARAQDAPSVPMPPLAAVGTAVTAGEIVLVTDMKGATVKGRLDQVSDSALRLRIGGKTQAVPAAEIRSVRWQKRDPVWTGVLIGAAIGAAPGIYWLIADPNECAGLCPEEYALIAAGAAIGGLIDRAVTKKVLVYSRNGRGGGLNISPLASPRRLGVQVTVGF
jgi:hypothetical protein